MVRAECRAAYEGFDSDQAAEGFCCAGVGGLGFGWRTAGVIEGGVGEWGGFAWEEESGKVGTLAHKERNDKIMAEKLSHRKRH